MDIRMKGMDGLEASRKILGEFPEAKILLLTTFSDDEYIIKALRLGTKGYLLKQDYASILPALQAVYSGQTVFGTEIMSKIPELLQSSDGFDYASRNINERELDIIRLPTDTAIRRLPRSFFSVRELYGIISVPFWINCS